MLARKTAVFRPFLAVSLVVLGAPTVLAQTTAISLDAVADTETVSSIYTCNTPVALANQDATSSYSDYYNARRYQYAYRYRNVRRSSYRPYRVYSYAPVYRYPPGVYPRTPDMMYYGPAVKVYRSPWLYGR